jgi:hypothetical protein
MALPFLRAGFALCVFDLPLRNPSQAEIGYSKCTSKLDGNGPEYCKSPARCKPGRFRSGFNIPGICTRLMYCPKQV